MKIPLKRWWSFAVFAVLAAVCTPRSADEPLARRVRIVRVMKRD